MTALHKEQLGQVIKRRRESLGLTQRDLADLAHVKEASTISRWERGERAPNNLDAIAQALQTSAAEILGELSSVGQVDRRRLDPDGPSQLDRIEAMLTELLRRQPESDPLEEFEQELTGAAHEHEQRDADTGVTAPPQHLPGRARQARG